MFRAIGPTRYIYSFNCTVVHIDKLPRAVLEARCRYVADTAVYGSAKDSNGRVRRKQVGHARKVHS